MREVNPRIVFCTDLGLRHDRPVQGHAEPRHRLRRLGRRRAADDRRRRPADHSRATRPSASTPARSTPRSASARRSSAPAPPARGCRFEVAQSDAAAAFNWNGIEGNKAYERPEDEVTGNDGDGKGPRRPVGDNSMTRVGALPVLPLDATASCCSWPPSASSGRTSAYGVGRPELYEHKPGAKYADHARGNVGAAPRAGGDLRRAHHRRVGAVRRAR